MTSSPRKVITVVGARPQFVKASVLSRLLQERPGIVEVLVHTGQHYDENMSERFFAELRIPRPKYALGIGGGSHGAMTGMMLGAIEEVLLKERPDIVLVYGDTNSTLAGALAAAKLHIPVAHVEAGLRSFNRQMPEELNRVVTDHLSSWWFAPTEEAVRNLTVEGIAGCGVHNVGDIMYDATLMAARDAKDRAALLAECGVREGGYTLVTVHRAENTDERERLAAIVEGLSLASRQRPVLWPLHPRTRGALERHGLLATLGAGVRLLPPVGYLDMVALERDAGLIVTDSGGVQKEAFFHKVPCITLRTETEWTELVALGVNRLVPPESGTDIAQAILETAPFPATDARPYGAGDTGMRIIQVLEQG